MCIIFFTTNSAQYKLIIAGNRDEFLERPSLRAHFWKEYPHILAGIDTLKTIHDHGSWMGISKKGRFAFITNKRQDPRYIKTNVESRGLLVRDFLCTDSDPWDYCNSITHQNYNGYFLVVGKVDNGMCLATNDDNDQEKLYNLKSKTIYGLSNGPFSLDHSNWPKVEKGKRLFRNAIENSKDRQELVKNLFNILRDSSIPPKDELPPPTFNAELEELLSSIRVDCMFNQKRYATRTHTVILVDHNNNVYFEEIDRFKLVQTNDCIIWEEGEFSTMFQFQRE